MNKRRTQGGQTCFDIVLHGFPSAALVSMAWVFNEKIVKAAQDFEDASVMDECGTLMPLFGAVFFDLNVGGTGPM